MSSTGPTPPHPEIVAIQEGSWCGGTTSAVSKGVPNNRIGDTIGTPQRRARRLLRYFRWSESDQRDGLEKAPELVDGFLHNWKGLQGRMTNRVFGGEVFCGESWEDSR